MKHKFSELPIPIFIDLKNAGNYKNIPVDHEHKKSIEPLVNIDNFNVCGRSFYYIEDGSNIPYCTKINGSLKNIYCREEVALKLQNVNNLLKQDGCELFVYDAYRPISCQQGIWDFFEAKIKEENPSFSEEELYNEIIQYVSDPTHFKEANSNTWPAHSTGASVDVCLRNIQTKELLDMGTYFDNMSEISHTDYFERQLENGLIDESDERLLNRRILYNAMKQEGFINYPYELWHFDFGNQMYIMNLAYHSNDVPSAAWYGYALPVKEEENA